MEEAREMTIKRNFELGKEFENRENQSKQELSLMYEELDRLKTEN
jgi:ABC-type branched-subunit amino acid transport system ATPase component